MSFIRMKGKIKQCQIQVPIRAQHPFFPAQNTFLGFVKAIKDSFFQFVMSIKSPACQHPFAKQTELAPEPSRTSCDPCETQLKTNPKCAERTETKNNKML